MSSGIDPINARVRQSKNWLSGIFKVFVDLEPQTVKLGGLRRPLALAGNASDREL